MPDVVLVNGGVTGEIIQGVGWTWGSLLSEVGKLRGLEEKVRV